MEGPETLTQAVGAPRSFCSRENLHPVTPELRAPTHRPEACSQRAQLRLPGCISRSIHRTSDKEGVSPFKCFSDMCPGFGVSPLSQVPAHEGWSPSTFSGASTRRSVFSCEDEGEVTLPATRPVSPVCLGFEHSCSSESFASHHETEGGERRGILSWLNSVSAGCGDHTVSSESQVPASGKCPEDAEGLQDSACWSWKPSACYEFVADINAHFALLEKLGEGSQGVVYRSKRLSPVDAESGFPESGENAEVCLKFFLEETLPLPTVERLCRLRVPHLVRHHGVVHDCRGQWLVMDLARGPELLTLISETHRSCATDKSGRRAGCSVSCKDKTCVCKNHAVARPLDEAACFRYLRQMLTALAGLHAEGLIHGDVKAENFILAEPLAPENEGHGSSVLPPLILSDLGSAVPVETGKLTSGERLRVPGGDGTPMYMAPELFTKSGYDGKVDVWAAGIVFALLLTGSTPFGNRDVLSFLWRHYSSQQVKCETPKTGTVLVARSRGREKQTPETSEGVPAAASAKWDLLSILASDLTDAADLAPLLDSLVDAELSSGEAWKVVSLEAKEIVRSLLRADPRDRPTAADALQHPRLSAHLADEDFCG
ncbi:putative protein kinase [Toxoplasma gondii ARI]|uniref:Protein kinase domain-containing protein n=1 Tax=Toxoplasma gondii ARI TaxID=1074872 RepID=A0A139XJN2_TOXGO|nr:putative protein kinase [Toxoplasma gondii ARI]